MDDTTAPILGAIDQGTSSSRFILFLASPSTPARVLASHQEPLQSIVPKPGWVEQDPLQILSTVRECIQKTCATLDPSVLSRIRAVGITNQRETTIAWDRTTGTPLHNAIVWNDARTAETVEMLTQATPSESPNHFGPETGLPLSTYFSAVKARWLFDNVPALKEHASKGTLAIGTVDSWIMWNLTGGVQGGVFVTDVTNASRTMLMNINNLKWDKELSKFFGVPIEALPEIRSSSEIYGTLSDGPLKGVPISGCLGDQQAALVGQGCLKPGSAKNTYGTGCFLLFSTGNRPVFSRNGLLTTVGYQFGRNGETVYALEGSVAVAGSAISWLRDKMKLIKSPDEINQFASAVPDCGGCYFVTAFSGLLAPYWKPEARGTIIGITQFTTREHLCRATLEAVSYQTRELLESMKADSGTELHSLRVDGGMSNSDVLMQIQSDIIGISVERPLMRETTALGAAYAAGLAVGVVMDLDQKEAKDIFNPKLSVSEREQGYVWWKKAVQRSLDWTERAGSL